MGDAEGTIILYLNVNTDNDPEFDGGTALTAGEPGSKTVIDVGQRPTPILTDWNGDGVRDLLAGAKDGKLYLFINVGSDTDWDFQSAVNVQENGTDLVVPTYRASPHVEDIDGDGIADLLLGNTEGQVLFYRNSGTGADPFFSGYEYVEADGAPIDIAGTPRSRVFLCDWNGDCYRDLLVGSGDGKVRLYIGEPSVSDCCDIDPPSAEAKFLPAYPNPFNPTVTIPFETVRGGRIRISIFDISGKLVKVLHDGELSAGRHEVIWNGNSGSGERAGSGVYFASFSASGRRFSQKLLLIR